MIKKLRIKFILMSMTALFVLLSVIVTSMNILNYRSVVEEADKTLKILAGNRGDFPDPADSRKRHGNLPPDLSPETPYESRYFSVLFDKNGNVLQTDTVRIKAVDDQQASALALQVLNKNKDSGFLNIYRFICSSEEDGTRITFLDCGKKLQSFRKFLYISAGMSVLGYLLSFFVIFLASGRIVRPAAESFQKQKQFITDAGHEIKTPLAIIKADTDVLEMDLGQNEWLTDIQKQTRRLTELTNDLVYLSRMEEEKSTLQMIDFPCSDVVAETAASFQALAQSAGKTFTCDIQPLLTLNGNEKAIGQLVAILLDNALKYSPADGCVSLTLQKKNKALQLSVSNTTEDFIPKEQLALLFERFYRPDKSRNSQTGGYGIGLSLAKAIVEAHKGKLSARSEEGPSLRITASFPT